MKEGSFITSFWVEEAYDLLVEYAKKNKAFTCEQLRIAIQHELPPATDLRAWGIVMRLAHERSIISKAGVTTYLMNHCHSGYCTLWKTHPDYFQG